MSYNIPTIDLHGFDRHSALAEANVFINNYYKLGFKEISIIHGIGGKVLKEELHKYLKRKKEVSEFKLNNNNLGETIIILEENKI